MIVALQVRVLLTPHEGLLEGPVLEWELLLAWERERERERERALALALDQGLVMVKG